MVLPYTNMNPPRVYTINYLDCWCSRGFGLVKCRWAQHGDLCGSSSRILKNAVQLSRQNPDPLSSAFVFRHVWLSATPWIEACQAPLSKEFPRQEYWSGLPFPPPGDLSDPLPPRIKPVSLESLALAGGFFVSAPPGVDVSMSLVLGPDWGELQPSNGHCLCACQPALLFRANSTAHNLHNTGIMDLSQQENEVLFSPKWNVTWTQTPYSWKWINKDWEWNATLAICCW